MRLQRVVRRSVADDVHDQLAGQILRGALDPGETLPAERSLTEQLGVNRQAVREALQRLAQDGLVSIRHGEPTRVADFRRDGSLNLLPHLLSDPAGNLDVAVVRSVLEMRACVGPDIARLCALRARPVQVDRLRSLADSMATGSADLAELASASLELWDTLADGADNLAYRLAFNSLRRCYEPFVHVLLDAMAGELRDHGTRLALVEAVAAGDGDGARDAAARLLSPSTVALTAMLGDLGQHQDRGAPARGDGR